MASSRVLPYTDSRNLSGRLTPSNSFQFTSDLYKVTDKGVFASLVESVGDFFFPPKLPPLQLSSTPVFLRDPMAGRRDPKATMLAVVINGGIVCALLWVGAHKITAVAAASPVKVVNLVAPPPPMPKAPPKAVVMSGGGGHPTPVPVSRGNPPKLELKPPILVTEPPKIETTKLPTPPPSVNVQNMMLAKNAAPNLGMSNAPIAAVSVGNGAGAGFGAGNGNGLGSGSGGNYGGGVFKIGGGVSSPQVLSAPDPQFTEEARQAKANGKVVVYLQVSADGRPMHVRVVHGLGMGLDEKALEAVRQYKFKPAMKDGHPVTVEMNVEVNFQIL